MPFTWTLYSRTWIFWYGWGGGYNPNTGGHCDGACVCSNKPKNLRWTFFWLHCSNCLELAAGQPESFSLPTFKVNLKTHFFRQTFWLIWTCQPLPVSYSCMCVSWGQGWGLGEMKLRIGSNIMIHFLYILLFLICTCTCMLYIVSCHNYMYYICET